MDSPIRAKTSHYVPLAVMMLAILVLLIVPLKIIGFGYLPPDDALADAAKAVSGKSWQEILVLKSDYKIDNHIGWHTFLRDLFLSTHCNCETLVLFSVVGLFTVVAWSALPWLARPEAWLISFVLLIGVETPMVGRLMLGRPLMISFLALLTILFLWKKRGAAPPGVGSCLLMTVCMAAAILLHGVWYFWALPVAAFVLARQWRWAAALAVCWGVGTILGAALTGSPVAYLTDAWLQAWNVMGRHASQGSLVTELQPTGGNYFPLLVLGAMLVLRQLGKLSARPLASDPVFWLVVFGWVLGHQAERFWDDWGLPALLVLLACDLDLFLAEQLPAESVNRLGVAAGLAVAAVLVMTPDLDGRWTASLTTPALNQDDPHLAGWLPAPGGIFYKADMRFFYQTFYRNPTAPWRYMVGFEPVLMPPEDFATYDQIRLNHGNPKDHQPWIDKMRAEDRLVLDSTIDPGAYLPNLEWKHAAGTMWIGRLKHAATSR